ncbi:MAG: acyl-CoA/acyl-ACP dehydrogenase [Alphaproteobacteria bacterium]|nr:acyl-CoA/acyl-ACP dehydrogenase [Alphaproteobacteria bacterium]
MDIGFSQEQEMLRDTARKFLDNACTTKFVRERMATPEAVTPQFWAQIAEQGWLGITYPEEHGGAGLGVTDLVVLMEEMGRAVMPGPYLATALLGGAAIREAGSPAQQEEFLPTIAEGSLRATLAAIESNPHWDAAGITMAAQTRRAEFSLSGSKLFVPDAHLADRLVVAARTREGSTMEDGISLFLVPKDSSGLSVALMPSIDETRKLCEVRFDNVTVPEAALLGELHHGWPALARVYDEAAVALSAEMCGGAQRVLEMTVEYAKLRETFGKPIGSYQGVKHKCSDMLVEVENAKSLTYYAAWALDENQPDARLAVSMAKAYASDASRKVSNAGIQLHGGIGMTWEHDLHLYMKRAKASEVAFGDATWHRERVAALMAA